MSDDNQHTHDSGAASDSQALAYDEVIPYSSASRRANFVIVLFTLGILLSLLMLA